jgi:hypothetical protein
MPEIPRPLRSDIMIWNGNRTGDEWDTGINYLHTFNIHGRLSKGKKTNASSIKNKNV